MTNDDGRFDPDRPDHESDPIHPPEPPGAAERIHLELVRDDTGTEVEDLAEDDTAPVPVDQPDPRPSAGMRIEGLRAGERRPVIPVWLRSRDQITANGRWLAGYLAHTSAYHAMRLPTYAGRLALRAPRGAVRALTRTARWTSDAEGNPVRQAAVSRADADTYLKLSRQRDARVRWRTTITIALSLLGVFGLGALLLAPAAIRWGVLAGVVALLGVLGSSPDRPLLDRAVVAHRVARLDSFVVVRALNVLGLAGITQALTRDPDAVTFTAPITRDGPGWRADVDLPFGVTANEVIARRDKLASGLGRPQGSVWPEANPEISPGRLTLWVGDQDMAIASQPPWPLLRGERIDYFKPFPFGTDPRGRPVTLDLVESNLLIGSLSGMGKSIGARLPLLAAALDPDVELWPFELKGTGDMEALKPVAARYGSGFDQDTIEAALFALRDLHAEVVRRAPVLKALPRELCKDNKVTPQIARMRHLRLHLLVALIDECQVLFTHPVYGKEAAELAEQIIKLGRALGIILILATQRPDARSLPTGVSANVGTRFCLRVMGQVENDMILGTSAYRNGLRATEFVKRDKGVGYLVGASDEPQIVRTYYVDGNAAERVIARARALRQAAGTLTGQAIGQDPTRDRRRLHTLLDDVLTVVPTAEGKVWSETVLVRLAELDPVAYGELTRDQLTAALKAHGITTGQVWGTTEDGKGANRRGIDRQDVANAATERGRREGRG